MSQQPTEVQGTWKLTIIQGPEQGQEFILGVITRIGRGKGNDIPLSDQQASRSHAIIERTAAGAEGEGFGYIINDRGSTNGTILEGQKINEPTRLRPGQVITIGDTQLAVQSSTQAGQPPAALPRPAAPAAERPARQTQPPPPQAAEPADPAPAAPPKKRRRWLLPCLVLLLLSICCLGAVGAGGYYALTSGLISRRSILNTVGFGYGEVSIVNLTDSVLEADMNPIDAAEDSGQLEYKDRFEPFDIGGWGGIVPGRYQLDIRLDGPPTSGSCTLQFESGNEYQIVAVPEGIAITLKGTQVSSADDLDLQTSALCKR